MTADTIRAALEAAHKARIASRWQRTRRMFQNGAQLEPGEDGSADTAVAIAAFHRDIAGRYEMASDWVKAAPHRALAAAVEEAARHE